MFVTMKGAKARTEGCTIRTRGRGPCHLASIVSVVELLPCLVLQAVDDAVVGGIHLVQGGTGGVVRGRVMRGYVTITRYAW